MAQNIGFLSNFINSHTNKHDPVFVYSFAPMLYFILERPNPTKYLIYYAGYLTPAEERATIQTLEEKKVTYIIDDGFDTATTPLSTWIKKQKKVTQMGNFTILMVRQ